MTDWGAPSGEEAPDDATGTPGEPTAAAPDEPTDWWGSGGRNNPIISRPSATWSPPSDGPTDPSQPPPSSQAAGTYPPSYAHDPRPSSASNYSDRTQSSPATSITLSSISPRIALLVVGAILMIVGSIGDWATAHVGTLSFGASGTDSAISQSYGVNGWVTFALGMILLLLAVLMVVSEDATLRSVAVLISFVSLGFTLYFFSRVLHDVLKTQPARFGPLGAGVDIGWGIVILLLAGLGAFAAALAEARRP